MKTLALLFSILILGCNDSKTNVTSKEKTTTPQNLVAHKDSTYFLLENTSKSEFESCKPSTNFFKNFRGDTILKKSEYHLPVKIVTSKKILEFHNMAVDTDSDARTEYFDLGYNATLNKHLLKVCYYESGDFMLIDHNTAHIDTIKGIPNYSPDKKKLISFYINPYNERKINEEYVDTGDIEVYQSHNDGLKAIVKESFDFIPIEIRWEDENTILIKAVGSLDHAKISRTSGTKIDDIKNFVYKKIVIKEFREKR